jgi:hypothetical protein
VYPKRFDKPWLFAACVIGLFNTHTLTFSFTFTLCCLYIIDAVQLKKVNRNIVIAFIVMLAGGLYIIPYLASNPMVGSGAYDSYVADHWAVATKALSLGILVRPQTDMVALVLLAICISLAGRTKPFLLFTGGLVTLIYIIAFVYPGDGRHGGIATVMAIGSLGIYDYYQDDKWNIIKKNSLLNTYGYWVLAIIFIFQLGPGIEKYVLDCKETYSDSRNAAAFINENNLQDHIMVGEVAWAASALLPYLPEHKEMYYVECQRFGSFYISDSCFIKRDWTTSTASFVQIATDNFKGQADKLLFIFTSPVYAPMAEYMDLLYQTEGTTIKDDEKYYIYKLKMKLN